MAARPPAGMAPPKSNRQMGLLPALPTPRTPRLSPLPSAVWDRTAEDDSLCMLALEDWRKTHLEQPGHQPPFESRLLTCEARLRKLDQLSLRLRPPSPVVAAVVVDLLYDVFETMPPALQQICKSLMKHVENAMYSEEPTSAGDLAQLKEVLGHRSERIPHFLVVRRQQATLERMEKRAEDMQQVVDEHLSRRVQVLEFIGRMQREQRSVLQQWLFNFWVVTYKQRKYRTEKMANATLSAKTDVTTPFINWRLSISQSRLDKAREGCKSIDDEASLVADRITKVEIKNEQQQKVLQKSLQESAAIKQKVWDEKEEHDRLQRLWDATQPELLLSVLAQSLEFFFRFVIRVARFTKLERRQLLLGKDPSPLLEGLAAGESLMDTTPDSIIICWINRAVARAQAAVQKLVDSGLIEDVDRPTLALVKDQLCVTNLTGDLSDGVVLCTLFAVLKAQRDGTAIEQHDFWPLEGKDLDLRAAHICSLLTAFAPTPRARCLLAPHEISSASSPQHVRSFLACTLLQHPLLDDADKSLNASAKAACRVKLEDVLTKVEELAGALAGEPPEDPTPLLLGGEDYQALATTTTEQLLLRWANAQIGSMQQRPIENFGSDLQDGMAIGLLLSVVAPDIAPSHLSDDIEMRLEQVTAVAARFVDFELLHASSIVECQSDMVAAFFAQLFLVRPNLGAKTDSLLTMHLNMLEKVCVDGLDMLHDNTQVMQLCIKLEAHWAEFTLAVDTIVEANKAMQSLNERMRSFLGDVLACRARGQPKTIYDAKEVREFIVYTSLNPDHIAALITREIIDSTMLSRTEDILKKNFRLLRDTFRYYATSAGGAGAGITLEGLLKLYQDCKLRSKDFAPHHMEVVFCDHPTTSSGFGGDRVLSPPSFIEVMLQSANLRFKPIGVEGLANQLLQLIEQNIRPHACQEEETVFQRMAYEPKVRRVLEKYSKELNVVFIIYASLDTSDSVAVSRVNTLNIKEFHMLLNHCDLLDEDLTEKAMEQIFEGIQQSATDESMAEEIGLDDEDELAFSEFQDGLIAIAAYKLPDPFTPFHQRVDAFIVQLFDLLRAYWGKQSSNTKDVMLMLDSIQKRAER